MSSLFEIKSKISCKESPVGLLIEIVVAVLATELESRQDIDSKLFSNELPLGFNDKGFFEQIQCTFSLLGSNLQNWSCFKKNQWCSSVVPSPEPIWGHWPVR